MDTASKAVPRIIIMRAEVLSAAEDVQQFDRNELYIVDNLAVINLYPLFKLFILYTVGAHLSTVESTKISCTRQDVFV